MINTFLCLLACFMRFDVWGIVWWVIKVMGWEQAASASNKRNESTFRSIQSFSTSAPPATAVKVWIPIWATSASGCTTMALPTRTSLKLRATYPVRPILNLCILQHSSLTSFLHFFLHLKINWMNDLNNTPHRSKWSNWLMICGDTEVRCRWTVKAGQWTPTPAPAKVWRMMRWGVRRAVALVGGKDDYADRDQGCPAVIDDT